MFARAGVICIDRDILNILKRNLLGEHVSIRSSLNDIYLMIALLLSSPIFMKIINLYLKVITSKVVASDKDKSSYDIVLCSMFRKISHLVGVNNMDTVQVYHDIHGHGSHSNETKYIYVSMFNNSHWHLLIISIDD